MTVTDNAAGAALTPSVTDSGRQLARWLAAVAEVQDALAWRSYEDLESGEPLMEILDWLDDCPKAMAQDVYRVLRALEGEARSATDFVGRRYRVGRFYRRLPPPARTRQCAVCGTSYTPSRSDSLTCSPACRKRRSRHNRIDQPLRTCVVNVRTGEPYDVYIGHRESRRYRLPESKWANPYNPARTASDAERLESIRRYREEHLSSRPDLVAALPELRGKTLACWCAPKACHGDVLAELADADS